MIHDWHAHLFHPRWYPHRFREALWRDFHQRQQEGKEGSASRRMGPAIARQISKLLTDDTGEKTLRIMDQVGIEKRVILVLDWGVELGEPEASIRQIHEEILGICSRHPDRLIGFAGVDPRRSDAVDVLAWATESLGARGLKLHPTGGWSLTERRTEDLVGAAAERGLPVLIHLGKTVDVLSDVNAQPEPFLELARRFPSIPFIAGHSGFDLWSTFVEGRAATPANVYFDISGWQERRRGDGENVRRDLACLHEAFPGRVCYGTDSPFYSFNLVLSERQWAQQTVVESPWEWPTLDEALGKSRAPRLGEKQLTTEE